VIRAFLERHAHYLKSPILELGAHCPVSFDQRPWMNLRTLRPDCEFFGCDVHPGNGVDLVAGYGEVPHAMHDGKWGSMIMSEVLEHVEHPAFFLSEAWYEIEQGGALLITVPFVHHLHWHPKDCFRYTPEGIRAIADGWRVVVEEELAHVEIPYSDHGERELMVRIPRQYGFVLVAQ
jgi:hypothetical protein